jgi:hypothetical protein
MMRATRYLVAAAVAAGLVLPTAASAATVVHPGDPITRSGSGCLLPDGAAGTVLLFIMGPGGKPYSIGTAPAAADGTWTVHGTMPAPYGIETDYRILAA